MNADQIKYSLTMRTVITRYGFEMKRGGYICCPFHEDKTPSLKIYDGTGGWHCFGCGKGGSCIDFVAQLFGLNYRQTLLRIGADFGYSDEPSDHAAERKLRAKLAAEQAEKNRLWRITNNLAALHCILWKQVKLETPWSDEWCNALVMSRNVDYVMEVAECLNDKR